MAKFTFTEAGTDVHIGEVKANDVRDLARGAESAHRGNMDTFHGTGMSEVARATDEGGRIVGWFNSHTGRFTSR